MDAFFATWASRLATLRAAISEKLIARRAFNAVHEARTPLGEATHYLDKHVQEMALERLQLGTDRTSTLREDRDLAQVESVPTFLAELEATRARCLAARSTRRCATRARTWRRPSRCSSASRTGRRIRRSRRRSTW
jgi:hypothetical protein